MCGRYPRSCATPVHLIARHSDCAGCAASSTTHRSHFARHRTHRTSPDLPAMPLGVSQRSRTSHRLVGEEGRGIFQDVALNLVLGTLLAQPLYRCLLGLHHALVGERLQRVCRQLAHPCPSRSRAHLGRASLRHCNASLGHQLDRFNLEFPA